MKFETACIFGAILGLVLIVIFHGLQIYYLQLDVEDLKAVGEIRLDLRNGAEAGSSGTN